MIEKLAWGLLVAVLALAVIAGFTVKRAGQISQQERRACPRSIGIDEPCCCGEHPEEP